MRASHQFHSKMNRVRLSSSTAVTVRARTPSNYNNIVHSNHHNLPQLILIVARNTTTASHRYQSTTTSSSSSGVLNDSNSASSLSVESDSSSFPLTIPNTSGRSKKRMQRRLRWKQERHRSNEIYTGETVGKLLQEKLESNNDDGNDDTHNHNDEVDHRTWRTILFPPVDDHGGPKTPPIQWPTSPWAWYSVLGEAWGVYKGTWEGFFSSSSSQKAVEESKDGIVEKQQQQQQQQDSTSAAAVQQMADNATKNIHVAQEEGGKLLQEVQTQTGIYTLEDVKRTARELMKVATAMLKEFMMEYRTGRDEEVDKMLHEYFQEEEEKKDGEGDEKVEDKDNKKSSKRSKRRPKRRIPTSSTSS